jgi:uncharacterized membrane protein YphA (DoxX/SURF4 family)
MKTKSKFDFGSIQLYLLAIIRIAIGWHFLYEGVSKIIVNNWSSAAYLAGSKWIFAPVFHSMAESTGIIAIVDFLNIWGMILVGIGLMLGLFTRWASAGGALMLLFYFIAYPPIPGYMLGVPAEGSYLWVNKTLIEFFVLMAFVFFSSDYHLGLDRLYTRWKEEKARKPVPDLSSDTKRGQGRREAIKDLITVPAIGVFAYALYKKKKWDSVEEKLLKVKGIDANTGATLLSFNYSTLRDLKGQIPRGIIKYTDKNGQPAQFDLSRLIMGGNLIGGWAHARDLIYVSKLIKTYHTDEKIFQTLALGEKCGLNAISSNPTHGRIFQKYKHEFRSKMKFISDCQIQLDFQKGIALSLASDFDALYCGGEMTDRWTNEQYDDGTGKSVAQRMELIRKGLEEIRSHGKPAGIGAHKIEAIKVCVEHGLKPDFWMKTCHNHNYWSAQPGGTRKDNYFDYDPEETIRFMATLEEPWIAFKVLAAGAIQPKVGLNYAYTNGADFVCMGMYDFQIVEDVNIASDILSGDLQRNRPWYS